MYDEGLFGIEVEILYFCNLFTELKWFETRKNVSRNKLIKSQFQCDPKKNFGSIMYHKQQYCIR